MPKVEHPRRKKTQHRSLQDKYKSFDKMQHSTWDKGETPNTRATVSAPKASSFASRIRNAITKGAGTAGRAGISGVRGAVRGLRAGASDPSEPFSLVKSLRNANLAATLAIGLAKKKKKK